MHVSPIIELHYGRTDILNLWGVTLRNLMYTTFTCMAHTDYPRRTRMNKCLHHKEMACLCLIYFFGLYISLADDLSDSYGGAVRRKERERKKSKRGKEKKCEGEWSTADAYASSNSTADIKIADRHSKFGPGWFGVI